MRRVQIIFVVTLLFSARISAQVVPDNVLNRIVKTYVDKGMKLEKSILPDFRRAHPTNLMNYNVCYPGKKIVVATITAKKPSDWFFKVSYGNQVAPKTHEISETTIEGNPYCLDWIITGFPSSFSDASEYCLNIIAYDKDNIDLPVYMYIFSKPI